MPETERVALMGGTFDPIHYGHLLMAEEALHAFDLDRVIFVPNGSPPIPKHNDVTSPQFRFEMCELAIADNPSFSVSRIEIDRPGPSYTLDTVRLLRANGPQIEKLYFITGADAVMAILAWHRYQELMQECEFIACTRPGFPLDQLREGVPPEILAHVTCLPMPGLDISSTELRNRVSQGRSIRYLTPGPVGAYIRRTGLYR